MNDLNLDIDVQPAMSDVTWGFRTSPFRLSSSHQWRRTVVKYGGQGQSSQAFKLFQIMPYVSDFQTFNNLGS